MELINDLKSSSRWVGEFHKVEDRVEVVSTNKSMKFDGMPLASTNQLGISQADSYLPGIVCVWWEQVVEGPIEFPKAMGVADGGGTGSKTWRRLWRKVPNSSVLF